MSKTVEYKRGYLYPKQTEIVDSDSILTMVEAESKAGSSHAALAWVLEQTVLGKNCLYLSGSSWTAEVLFGKAVKALNQVEEDYSFIHGVCLVRNTHTKGEVWFTDESRIDSLCANTYDCIVIDKSGYKHEDIYKLLKTLYSTKGRAIVIREKGTNHYEKMFDNVPSFGKLINLTIADAIDGEIIDKEQEDYIDYITSLIKSGERKWKLKNK